MPETVQPLTDAVVRNLPKKDKQRIGEEIAAQTFEKLAQDWHGNKFAGWHPYTEKRHFAAAGN